jgi:hypothetical protein
MTEKVEHPRAPMVEKVPSATPKTEALPSQASTKCVSELLAYNFKQFGGLIKVVPLIFADVNCTLKDLGQLVARAHFWLSGLRGRDRARQASFHNRFVESFFRCWYHNSRGLGIVAARKDREAAQADCDFFVAQVSELMRIAENDITSSQGPMYLVSVLDDLRATGLYVMPALAGWKKENSKSVELSA